MKTLRHILAGLTALALPLGLPAAAQANPYGDNLSVRLLPGWRDDAGRHVAGIELRLADGWKTYWRTPGEAGVPPVFTWRESDNLAGARIVWPRPIVFETNGLRSIGYEDRVVLPLVLTPRDAETPITLRGEAMIGICREVCVPVEMHITGVLAAAGGPRDPAIAAALAARPYTASQAQVGRVDCRVAPGEYGMELTVDIAMPSTGGDETLVVETGDPEVWAADAEAQRSGGRLTGETELIHNGGGAFALDRSDLTITVLGRDRAVEIRGCN